MGAVRTAFLEGALRWVYDGAPPDACPACGYSWSSSPEAASATVVGGVRRIGAALEGRDGTVEPPDGSWSATAYVWHLADLASSWSERWVQIGVEPGARLVGWDPDVLAAARGYRSLPTSSGLWALERAVEALAEQTTVVGYAGSFLHGEWGHGTVGDAMVWLGHEFTHHAQDVERRAR